MSKKVPIKGSPDFTTISNDRLNGFIDLAQQMIFSYKSCDTEVYTVMQKVWKQLSDERVDRLAVGTVKELEREETAPLTVHKIKAVKPKALKALKKGI